MNQGNGELVYDGDYGSVPNFYTTITIGEWDKPFKIVEKTAKDSENKVAETTQPAIINAGIAATYTPAPACPR